MRGIRIFGLLSIGLLGWLLNGAMSYGSSIPPIALQHGEILSSQFNQGIIYRVAGTPGSTAAPFATVERGITGLAQLPNGDIAVASSREDRILRIDATSGFTKGILFDNLIDNPRGLTLHRGGTLWVSALSNDQVVAIDAYTGEELHRLTIPRAFAIAADADRIYVTGQAEGSVHMIDALTGDYLGVLAQNLGPNLEEMTINRAGDLLIGDSADGILRVDAATGAILARAPTFTPGPVAIDHDGFLISKNIDGRLVRLDPSSLTEINTIANFFPPQHGMLVYRIPEPAAILILGVSIATTCVATGHRRHRRVGK